MHTVCIHFIVCIPICRLIDTSSCSLICSFLILLRNGQYTGNRTMFSHALLSTLLAATAAASTTASSPLLPPRPLALRWGEDGSRTAPSSRRSSLPSSALLLLRGGDNDSIEPLNPPASKAEADSRAAEEVREREELATKAAANAADSPRAEAHLTAAALDQNTASAAAAGDDAAHPASPASAFAPPRPAVADAPDAAPAVKDHTKSLSAKLSNAYERTVPAAVLLALATALLKFAGSNGLVGLVLALQAGMYHEATSVVSSYHARRAAADGLASFGRTGRAGAALDQAEKWWWFATAMVATSLRLIAAHSGSNLWPSGESMGLLAYGMAAAGIVGAVVGMESRDGSGPELYRGYLGGVAGAHFVLLFLIGQSSYWIRTVHEYGLPWVLYPALLVIVNDTMAYVFGLTMGRTKLLPRLSPKKTAEGFAGALVSTMAVSVPLLRWVGIDLGDGSDKETKVLALTLALFVSLVAPFGGFLASATKRAHGAKDFGTLIPGHGGVVDRFDCQVVTAPFVYLLLKRMGVSTATS